MEDLALLDAVGLKGPRAISDGTRSQIAMRLNECRCDASSRKGNERRGRN